MSKSTKKVKHKDETQPAWKSCTLIQWGKLKVDDKGNPICPQCGGPAELILGFFGNPCYGHKIED